MSKVPTQIVHILPNNHVRTAATGPARASAVFGGAAAAPWPPRGIRIPTLAAVLIRALGREPHDRSERQENWTCPWDRHPAIRIGYR